MGIIEDCGGLLDSRKRKKESNVIYDVAYAYLKVYNKNFVSCVESQIAIRDNKEKENANMSFAIFTPEAFPRCLDFPRSLYYS